MDHQYQENQPPPVDDEQCNNVLNSISDGQAGDSNTRVARSSKRTRAAAEFHNFRKLTTPEYGQQINHNFKTLLGANVGKDEAPTNVLLQDIRASLARMEERQTRMEGSIQDLSARQTGVEGSIQQLSNSQTRMERTMDHMADSQTNMSHRIENIEAREINSRALFQFYPIRPLRNQDGLLPTDQPNLDFPRNRDELNRRTPRQLAQEMRFYGLPLDPEDTRRDRLERHLGLVVLER